MMHYDGKKWSSMASDVNNALRDSLGVSHIMDIWGQQCIGDVWGSSSSNIFATTVQDLILYYNGEKWSTINTGTEKEIMRIWGSSTYDIFAVGEDGIILHLEAN